MIGNLVYLYLFSPLHTGGTTQEGNLLGIARESHTDLPYIPSSSIRGRLRARVDDKQLQYCLFGNELTSNGAGGDGLKQGAIWIGDGSLLWLPVPSLSHGVVWISCPLLLRRWARFQRENLTVPEPYSTTLDHNKPVYLKDAILKVDELKEWKNSKAFIPNEAKAQGIESCIVLPDRHCATLIQMSLWRQVKIKLDEHKTVDGGFRYEEAIPPDTLMYFPWGLVSQSNHKAQADDAANGEEKNGKLLNAEFEDLLQKPENSILQIGGQEGLGRGFVQTWLVPLASN